MECGVSQGGDREPAELDKQTLKSLQTAADLLKVSLDQMQACLTYTVTVTRGESIKKQYIPEQAYGWSLRYLLSGWLLFMLHA
jgi:hypothetical protein